jgi:hypothetical protein
LIAFRPIACSLLAFAALTLAEITTAQQRTPGFRHDLFDRRGAHHQDRGWTIAVGVAGFRAEPGDAFSQSFATGADGFTDTLHRGEWAFRGALSPMLSIERWVVPRESKRLDRWGWHLAGSRRAVTESFDGDWSTWDEGGTRTLTSGTLGGEAEAWTLEFGFYAARCYVVRPRFFLEGRLGSGLDLAFFPSSAPLAATSPQAFNYSSDPPPFLQAGLDASLSAGLAIRDGRFLRLQIGADLLQLGGFDWMSGSYRPWRVLLAFDFQKPRAAPDCPTGDTLEDPNRTRKGVNLFGPEMQDHYTGRKKRRRSKR